MVELKPSPESIQWPQVFKNSAASSFHLDLGSGCGEYLSKVALNQPDINWIGVEIKKRMVEYANEKHNGVDNYTMVWANLLNRETLDLLFQSLPTGEPASISILHPDPNFKKKHKKRMLVTESLLDAVSSNVDPGTLVYVQTDVCDMDIEMHAVFDKHLLFEEMKEMELDEPILGVPTNREAAVVRGGGAIYRRCYRRRNQFFF